MNLFILHEFHLKMTYKIDIFDGYNASSSTFTIPFYFQSVITKNIIKNKNQLINNVK